MLLKNGKLNFDGEEDDTSSFNLVMDLEKGIELHKQKDYKNAWKCFKENADLGNLSAKYWKGYYLYNGYDDIVEKDQISAMELFREASDNDHPHGYKVDDAQYRYAILLISNLNDDDDDDDDTKQKNYEQILHFLKLAANNNNVEAMYYLGGIYLKGKLGEQKNEELGLLYLNLAANNNHEKSINLLKELGKPF